MAVERDEKTGESAAGAAAETAPVHPAPISRRMLMRGAMVSVPTILTLHSGALLANASSMMVTGNATTGGASTEDGVYHCLDTGGQPSGNWNLDNGSQVTNLTVGQPYDYTLPDTNEPVTGFGDEMCGTGALNVNGGSANIPKGMLLSATAYASLYGTGAINVVQDL